MQALGGRRPLYSSTLPPYKAGLVGAYLRDWMGSGQLSAHRMDGPHKEKTESSCDMLKTTYDPELWNKLSPILHHSSFSCSEKYQWPRLCLLAKMKKSQNSWYPSCLNFSSQIMMLKYYIKRVPWKSPSLPWQSLDLLLMKNTLTTSYPDICLSTSWEGKLELKENLWDLECCW